MFKYLLFVAFLVVVQLLGSISAGQNPDFGRGEGRGDDGDFGRDRDDGDFGRGRRDRWTWCRCRINDRGDGRREL